MHPMHIKLESRKAIAHHGQWRPDGAEDPICRILQKAFLNGLPARRPDKTASDRRRMEKCSQNVACDLPHPGMWQHSGYRARDITEDTMRQATGSVVPLRDGAAGGQKRRLPACDGWINTLGGLSGMHLDAFLIYYYNLEKIIPAWFKNMDCADMAQKTRAKCQKPCKNHVIYSIFDGRDNPNIHKPRAIHSEQCRHLKKITTKPAIWKNRCRTTLTVYNRASIRRNRP